MTANILATIFARNAFITDILFFPSATFSVIIPLQFSSIPMCYSYSSHMQQSFHYFVGPVRYSCFRLLGSSGRIRERGNPGITVELSRIIEASKGLRRDYHVGCHHTPYSIYGHQQLHLTKQYRTGGYHLIHFVRNGLYGLLQVLHQSRQTLHLSFVQCIPSGPSTAPCI